MPTTFYPLHEKLNDSRFEVVHRAYNLYAAGGFQVPKHRTLFPNVSDGQGNVLSCHSVYERIVLGRATCVLPVTGGYICGVVGRVRSELCGTRWVSFSVRSILLRTAAFCGAGNCR